jgi:Flp pilus assembly protein TadG
MQHTTDTSPHNYTAIRRHGPLVAVARDGVLQQSGQALVEFALVLPILLLALFGITHLGLALVANHDQTHIAEEVARYTVVNQNPGAKEGKSLQQWARAQADNGNSKSGKVCITFPNGATAREPVTVEFTSTMNWLPLGSTVIKALKGATNVQVKATATERLEQTPTEVSAGCYPK